MGWLVAFPTGAILTLFPILISGPFLIAFNTFKVPKILAILVPIPYEGDVVSTMFSSS